VANYQAVVVKSGLTSLISADTLAFDAADRLTSGVFTLGGANSTTLTIGAHANTTTINIGGGAGLLDVNVGIGAGVGSQITLGTELVEILGDLLVQGAETVVGVTEFGDTVTFKGPVTFGDDLGGNDTVAFAANTRITSSIVFDGASSKVISIDGSGNRDLQIKASAGGGDVYLTPGGGSLYFGNTDGTAADSFQILIDGDDTIEAGIRYNASTDVWESRPNSGSWLPIHTGDIYDVRADLTTTGLAAKDVGYISGTSTVGFANNATSAVTARACCVVVAAGKVLVSGLVTVTSLTAVAAGDPVYLSATNGRVTATAPSTEYLVFLGYCTIGNASPGDIQILFQPARPIAL